MLINSKTIEGILADRDMTKAALAAASGISRQTISTSIRRGSCEPKTAGKIARALGVPVESIIEEVAK